MTPNLIKLAPSLTVEERYRIVIPDTQKIFMGEAGSLSESEIRALTYFDSRAAWEAYAYRFFQLWLAYLVWTRDISKEKYAVLARFLLAHHQLWQVIRDVDESASNEKKAEGLETLKKYVVALEEELVGFYAYREAILCVEQDLYGVSLFDEKTSARISNDYQTADNLIDDHNAIVRILCTNKAMKKHFKPIVQDMESFIINKPVAGGTAVDELVSDLKGLATTQVKSRH